MRQTVLCTVDMLSLGM